MKKWLFFLYLMMIPALAFAAQNTRNASFSKAKQMMEYNVYYDHRITVYCGYTFYEDSKINLPDCFFTEKYIQRAHRIEWEHAVPAENFGRFFHAWREGDPRCVDRQGKKFKGRTCAEKVSLEYRYMQADMYNLFPAVGAVNAVRSNRQYAELSDAPFVFGSCKVKVAGRRFEPPARAKGEVARAALYMDREYHVYRLSRQQKKLFETWSKQYPVTQWECTRVRRIEALQGNENRVVKALCIDAGMW